MLRPAGRKAVGPKGLLQRREWGKGNFRQCHLTSAFEWTHSITLASKRGHLTKPRCSQQLFANLLLSELSILQAHVLSH